jgi:hypothetical protein
MRKKFVSAVFALIGLGTFVVLGSSTDLVGKMVEALQQGTTTQTFSSANPADDLLAKKRKSKLMPPKYESTATEIHENMLWYIVFNFTKRLENEAEKANQQGQDGSLYTNYFVRQGHLSDEKDLILKETARKYIEEIDPLEQKAQKIMEELSAEYTKREPNSAQSPPPPTAELKKLQEQKDKIIVRYRDDFKLAIGEDAFNNFSLFLTTEFSEGATSRSIAIPSQPELDALGFTWIIWDDSLPTPLITGFSQLYYFYGGFGFVYRPSLDSLFFNATTSTGLNLGSDTGFYWFPALYFHPVFVSTRGNQYCTVTDFYLDLYDGPFLVDEIFLGSSPAVCHIVGLAPPPTPTPTPNPTPTPSPTPPCEPLNSEALVPCLPTPTPTPAPTPSVSVTPIDVVEKYGERNFSVTIRNNGTGSTRFTLTTTAGTGTATFENDTNATVMLGNAENQTLKVKGVLESSQIDNIRIEVKMNNDSTVRASDNFTVAVINSLVFERIRVAPIKNPDFPLDENPGIDGVPNPDGSEGRRIFPDKNTGLDLIDHSVLRVKATVSPVLPSVQVYFGSYDLDDPSANTTPIDANASMGNDNNGSVNGSRSGDFTCSTPPSGPVPGQIGCTTASDGTSAAAFKTTMQPGDNFAVAASLSDQYRNGINVNSMDGSILSNSTNQTIPISGASHPDNVAGLRTRMLTVWRKLHIEIDSMGPAHENYVRGEVSGSTTIARGRSKTLNVTANPMEVNRFENGRMELAAITSFLDVISNTATTITVKNIIASDIVLTNNVSFELLSASGANSAVGTIPTGQTITPMQTVTLNFAGTPLTVNAFSNGQMVITPVLRSLTITSNTATSVTVTNNGPGSIAIANATHFRLYDDDDMDNLSPTNAGSALNGDEGEDVVAPDTSLLTDNSSNPANNVFAPAYIVPRYDLGSGDSDVVFNPRPNWDQISPFLSLFFQNLTYEARSDFWTIYLLGAYQPPTYSQSSPTSTQFVIDGDPLRYQCGGGLICTTYGAANATSSEPPATSTIIRRNDGTGVMVFAEVGRPNEYAADYLSRPVSRAYTLVHEVGHLFRGVHSDGDLMAPTLSRTVGRFSDTSLDVIRKTEHP